MTTGVPKIVALPQATATRRQGADTGTDAEPKDLYRPGVENDTGIYRPQLSLMAALKDHRQASQELADGVWKQFAVARDGRQRAPQITARYQVLGHPRINRAYPDPALEKSGVAQDLPMEVSSKFKWLMSEPLVRGKDNDVVLLHTQYEGGPTWLDDGEYECRDFFIALRRDPDTGTYKETASLMTRKPGFQEVFRSTDGVQAMQDDPNQFMIHLEEGTYNGIYGSYTHLYEIGKDGIEQVGAWNGHLSAEEIRKTPSQRQPDDRILRNPGPEVLDGMDYSKNWQTDL